jgi:hypothetical protein
MEEQDRRVRKTSIRRRRRSRRRKRRKKWRNKGGA